MFQLKRLNENHFFTKGMIIFTILFSLVVWTGSTALAKEGQKDALVDDFLKATQGKTVAWSRVWAGILETEWTNVMRMNFERYGINFIVRDSDFKADVQRQTLETLIAQKPDVLIVQSINRTNTARAIKKAMKQGIYVIEVNMASVQAGDGYVGINTPQVGRMIAEDIVKEIGGGKTSGKVAIIEGDTASPYSHDQAEAAMEVFKNDSSIQVVSRQPAAWDPNKGNEIISTVIQAHPDLAAVYSVWAPMTAGVGHALKNAGSKAKIWAASDGQMPDCDLFKQGLFHKLLSYRANIVGENAVTMALSMLQNKDKIKPGEQSIAQYTALYWITKPEDIPYNCWYPYEKGME